MIAKTETPTFESLMQCEGVKKHEVKTIVLEDLMIDLSYQRETTRSKVRRISENLLGPLIGLLLVSFRSNVYWLIDGGHRCEALKRCGIEEWPCLLLHGLTARKEAQLWVEANTVTTKPRAIDEFKSRVFCGDPTSVRINETVEDAGYFIDFKKENTANAIACVRALERVYLMGGAALLSRVLNFITAAWPNATHATRKRLSDRIIRGLGVFFVQHQGNFEPWILLDQISNTKPQDLVAEAAKLAEILGVTAEAAVADRIGQLYNDRRQKRNRLRLISIRCEEENGNTATG